MQEVTGSSPVPSTKTKTRGRRPRVFQIVKKVPTGRHARTVGTHTWKFGAESVRAALRRVRGSAPNFVPRGIPGGRNFCPAYAGRNGFPLERVVFRHAAKPGACGLGFCFARASQRRPRFESCTAAQPSRVLRTKQARQSRGRGLNFQAHCMRAGNSGHRNPTHQTRRIRTQFSTRKGSDTFFLWLKFCVAAAGQLQLHKTIKGRAPGKGALPFCCGS